MWGRSLSHCMPLVYTLTALVACSIAGGSLLFLSSLLLCTLYAGGLHRKPQE